jgi:hypothetical protein
MEILLIVWPIPWRVLAAFWHSSHFAKNLEAAIVGSETP